MAGKSTDVNSVNWEKWFAWYPVRTVSGRRVWFDIIYRRRANTYVDYDNWTHYTYAELMDILRYSL